jgi:CubicO group peptidase (beta-lactamase class C family)
MKMTPLVLAFCAGLLLSQTAAAGPPLPEGKWAVYSDGFSGEMTLKVAEGGQVTGTMFDFEITGRFDADTSRLTITRLNAEQKSGPQLFTGYFYTKDEPEVVRNTLAGLFFATDPVWSQDGIPEMGWYAESLTIKYPTLHKTCVKPTTGPPAGRGTIDSLPQGDWLDSSDGYIGPVNLNVGEGGRVTGTFFGDPITGWYDARIRRLNFARGLQFFRGHLGAYQFGSVTRYALSGNFHNVTPGGLSEQGWYAETYVGPPGPRKSLEEAVDIAAAETGFSADSRGAAVAVIHKGKVIFKKSYGLANLAERPPTRSDSTFELASIIKTFVAMAICVLHDQGKLSFDDDIRKHVPEFPVLDKQNPIRIRHLLQHTSGLYVPPDGPDAPEKIAVQIKGRDGYHVDLLNLVAYFKQHPEYIKLRFPPGQQYEYSGFGYFWLGVIIQRVSKKDYGKFLEEDVFKALGMNHAWVFDLPNAQGDRPRSTFAINSDATKMNAPRPFGDPKCMGIGAYGVHASVDDLVQWDEAVRARKLLKAETWQEVLTPSKTRDGKTNWYGFGFVLGADGAGKLTNIGHSGSGWGISTLWNRNFQNDLGIIILLNTERDYGRIVNAIGRDWGTDPRSRWDYDGGYFVITVGKEWTERSGNQTFHFEEVARTREYVELHDKTRQITVRLYADRHLDNTGDNKSFVKIHDGKWAGADK